jgi:hypothetical protein
LSGEFLEEPKEDWVSLILSSDQKETIQKVADQLKEKKEKMAGRGLLFIGPPGTGKTKTGRVLMSEVDSTFIWVSSRDFRRIGALNALTLSFSMARDLAPSILFIEDIDTWLTEWGGTSDSVVVDLLKTELDGLKQNYGILTIMTSNYPEKLPASLLDRPGRFHHIINFELPDREERKEMLEMWAGKIEEKLFDEILKKTEKFSGAHIKELVEYARIIAEEDSLEIGEALLRSLEKLMEQRELIEQIRANKIDHKILWNGIREKTMKKEIIIEKGAIPFKDLGYLEEDTAWDGPGETAKAEVEDLKAICAWYDSENPDLKGSYKLPHHKTDGHKAIWNGVRAAMGAILGARGGVDIPNGDKKSVYNHLAKHYGHWDKEAPEFKDYSDEDLKELFPEEKEEKSVFAEKLQTIIKLGDVEEWVKAFNGLKEQIAELKEGRMLSHKNEQMIKDAISALQSILKADKAGTPEEEEKPKEIKVEIEKAKEETLEEKVKRCVKGIDMDKLIKESVDLRIKKIRGVVE